MNICVYAASSTTLASAYYAEAEQLGHLMAESGHTLVFGAGRGGSWAPAPGASCPAAGG